MFTNVYLSSDNLIFFKVGKLQKLKCKRFLKYQKILVMVD